MRSTLAEPPTTSDPKPRALARLWSDRSFRAVLLLLAVALPVLLHAGRERWFFLDEWDFLLERDLAEPSSMLAAWFGHNVVLPATTYRLMLATFGVSSYQPYLLLGILGHFAVVLAVWAVARRLGVRGWIAVAVVVPLTFLGAGRVNIVSGFQITMTAALALSLLHLLLADRDGPWSGRDRLAVACGAAGLLCSGVAVAGTIGVGVAVLLRRGPKLAAAHTVPLGLLWSAWYLLAPYRGLESHTSVNSRALQFVAELSKASLGGLGGGEIVALGLGALAVLGVASAVVRARRAGAPPPWWSRVAVLAGCLTVLASFSLLVAVQRLSGESHRAPTEGRYVYIVAALTLPLLALGIEAVARHRPVLAVVPLALLAVGVPHNVRRLDDPIAFYASRDLVLAFATSDQLATTSGALTVELRPQGIATIDGLRRVAALPGLPDGSDVPAELRLHADLMLGLHQGPTTGPPDCPRLRHDRRRLEPGDTVDFEGEVDIVVVDGADRSLPYRFEAVAGRRLTASGPLEVEVDAVGISGVYVCDGQ